MSTGDPDPGPEPGRIPAWALWVMRLAIVFGALMIAWNVWVIRGLVTATEPVGAGSWAGVVIQTSIGMLLIAQGVLYLRRAR